MESLNRDDTTIYSDENNQYEARKRDFRNITGSTTSFSRYGRSNGTFHSVHPQASLNGMEESKDVVIGRHLFVAFILVVAGVLGVLSFYVLSVSEENLASQQYISITEGALLNIRNLAESNLVHGSQIMANHVGWAYPNANEDWPFVWLRSYWDIMEEVLPTGIWSGVNLSPIVWPHEAKEFEDYAYTKIAESFGEESDMGATSHFGKGIWVWDENDHRYHDTTGIPNYPGSPYEYMAPKLQSGLVFSPDTMMNIHGFEIQGLALDAVMNCSKTRKENHTQHMTVHKEEELTYRPLGCSNSDGRTCAPSTKKFRCSTLSGMLPPKNIRDEHGVSGFIATPIYPANDPYDLVGFIFGIVDWVEVMIETFPKDTIGIDCVFGDSEHNYTVTLDEDHGSELICEDDCHDTKYDSYLMTTTIIDPNLLSDVSVTYQMTCYPNDRFFSVFQTNNPAIAATGAVGIIFITFILFFLYDFFVRREFRSKKDLFEAKRKFVRFVSHEVRTPMNSVCMGLSVLQEEVAEALCYERSVATKRTSSSDAAEPALGREQIQYWFDLANEISYNAFASVDILDDVLNYDKIVTGVLTLEYTIIPIWNLIEDTVAEFKLPMTKKKINVYKALRSGDDLETTIHKAIEMDSSQSSSSFIGDDCIEKGNTTIDKTVPNDDWSQSSSSFISDDTIQKSNISDMEAGRKSNWLEAAKKQKIVGDPIRITQVIRNLVSNAIKFSDEGGDIFIFTRFLKTAKRRSCRRMESQKEERTFELKSKEVITCDKLGEIVFTIKDSGAGLSRSQLNNLFGAGVQFDANELQSGKGSGLGLHIAKGIVEQHDGSLLAHSEGKGLGCEFTMRLPIYDVPDDVFDSQQFMKRRRRRPQHSFERLARSTKESEAKDNRVLNSLDRGDNGMSKLKILLVDDSVSNRKLLKRLMTMRGHLCDQANDGLKGMEMAIKAEQFAQPYDLIFMDYEMPTMNGPEAVKQIRKSGSDVFVIGLTGNIMADDVSYFHACGANAVFPKPFRVRELETLLAENLARDANGRIVEKESSSTAFDLTPLGLLMEEEGHKSISPLHRERG